MADTHPEALRVFLKIQGRMTAEQKLRRVVEMYETMTAAQMAEVRHLHPDADDREVFLRVTARRLISSQAREAVGLAHIVDFLD
jgi:hypothetical protein